MYKAHLFFDSNQLQRQTALSNFISEEKAKGSSLEHKILPTPYFLIPLTQ